MAKAVLLEREGLIKTGFVGFSWTFFFFGFFVPLLRGDFKGLIVLFLITVAISALTMGAGFFIFNIIISFLYNKYYTERLLREGFRPADPFSEKMLSQYNIFYEG